jgi:cellulose synthase/poly-beta-1,6-N-acetylglucosamine synthase-like glycosyltransferase
MTDLTAVLLVWIPLGVMVYNWILFPALLTVAVRLKRPRPVAVRVGDLPCVSVIIAAWNEELCIADKIRNCLAFDYPADRLDIIIGTDAVTDGTNDIVRSFDDKNVRLWTTDERLGKSEVLNRLVPLANGDLILFTDADVLMAPDALRLAVGRFSDEKVGVLLFHYQRRNEDGHVAEGLWDRYENWLKRLEGDLGAAVGVYGWAMMLRKPLCQPIPPETINDDWVLGTRPCRWGYSAVYEPRASSWTRAETARVEFTRKTRISRGNIQAFFMMPDLFLPKFGVKSWVLFSHKFLRWVTPFLMIAILAGSAAGWRIPFFRIALMAQLAMYVTTPLVLVARGPLRKLLFPQYYVWANLALLAGYWQYLFGRRLAYNWLRTVRG